MRNMRKQYKSEYLSQGLLTSVGDSVVGCNEGVKVGKDVVGASLGSRGWLVGTWLVGASLGIRVGVSV